MKIEELRAAMIGGGLKPAALATAPEDRQRLRPGVAIITTPPHASQRPTESDGG